MYIVTYREFDQRTEYWFEGSHVFETKEDAIECMEDLYEMNGAYRTIKLWNASEIEHEMNMKATVTLKEK